MKTKSTLWIIGIIAVVILLAVYFIVANEGSNSSSEVITLGASIPLTGEAASLGDSAAAGINLAVQEINNKGGINGRKIEVIIEDDQCNNRGGLNSFSKLVNVDKVVGIIGPICSAAAGAGVPIAQENNVPTVIWASAPHLTLNKDFIFRSYPSDSFQGEFAADYLYKLGKRKVAVVYVQNDWGQGIRDVFVESFEELGGEIVVDEGVAQDSKDIRSIVTKIKDANPDAIFFPAYPGVAVPGLKQIKEQQINVPILGGDVFEAEEIIKSGFADGVMYTIGTINNPEDFRNKIKAISGQDPNIAAPLGYDTVYIFAEVIESAGTDPEAIKKALSTYRTTKAVSLPVIEFDEEGDLASAEFEIKIIEDGGARTLS